MALSSAEVESLRFVLGYGNIDVGAYPYTPDGFKELFDQVIAPNLTGDTETTASATITAGATATVTPVSMTEIVPHARLIVDVADLAEIVTVRAVTGSTFTALFANAHTGTYPVAIWAGHARLRYLLHRADQAWIGLQDSSVGDVAGIKQVDKGDIEWFEGFRVLKDRVEHYKTIVWHISSLVRVQPAWAEAQGNSGLLESY